MFGNLYTIKHITSSIQDFYSSNVSLKRRPVVENIGVPLIFTS